MNIVTELLPDTFLLQPDRFDEMRGSFVKTYNEKLWSKLGIDFDMKEEYYSVSRKGVIRGMHFQIPPEDHKKMVYCLGGSVLDVLLDLRVGPNYGKFASAVLSSENRQVILIPKGIAHGFLALEENSLMLYKTSTVHAPEFDRGIKWDSFGFEWSIEAPIISARDQQHPVFSEFDKSCFKKI